MFSHVISLNPLAGVNPKTLMNLYRPKEELIIDSPQDIPLKKQLSNQSVQSCKTSSSKSSQVTKVRKIKSHSSPYFSKNQNELLSKRLHLGNQDEGNSNQFIKKVKTSNKVLLPRGNAISQPLFEIFDKVGTKPEKIETSVHPIVISLETDIEFGEFSEYDIHSSPIVNIDNNAINLIRGTTPDKMIEEKNAKNSINLNFGALFGGENNENYQASTDVSPIDKFLSDASQTSTPKFSNTNNDTTIQGSPKKAAFQDCLDIITPADIQRLEPGVYLNDNIINFYLRLIETGFLTEERRKRCYFFNTYFMSRLCQLFAETNNDFSLFDSVYEKMEKWTKKTNIFEKDFLFIPVHKNEHWSLIVLCYPQRFLTGLEMPFVIFMDSFCRMDTTYASLLYQFFLRELKAKKPSEYCGFQVKAISLGVKDLPYYQHMIPRQSNGQDCGLYLLQYAELFAEDEGYILGCRENLNKIKWFPKGLIQEKRQDIKKLIQNLSMGQYGAISQYLMKRNDAVKNKRKIPSEYDVFEKSAFEEAFNMTFSDAYVNPDYKVGLMLDHYFGNFS